MGKSKIKSVSKDELQKIVDKSVSLRDILSFLGYKSKSGDSMKVLKQKLIDEQINMETYKKNKWSNKERRTNLTLEDILVENSDYFNRNQLKKRLVAEGYLKYECSICKLGDSWNGNPIVHVLDHINGVNNDNRIENLRLLCPNCNSQQDTFSGRNMKKTYSEDLFISAKTVRNCEGCGKLLSPYGQHLLCRSCTDKKNRKFERPSKEKLRELLECYSFVKTGKLFGVSDNAIRKWCKQYNLPTNAKDYKK